MKKAKEIILYIIFGILTTLVNFVVLKIFKSFIDVLIANIIAWFVSVIFAYITNKLFVFESKSWKLNVIKKEIPSFAAARLLSLGFEEAGLIIMIKWLSLDISLGKFALWCFDLFSKFHIVFPKNFIAFFDGEMMVKLILAVVVIVLNYIFSKLIIFKKSEAEEK